MTDERDLWTDAEPELPGTDDDIVDDDISVPNVPLDQGDDVIYAEAVEVTPDDAVDGDDYVLLSTDEFEQELDALEPYAAEDEIVEGVYESDPELVADGDGDGVDAEDDLAAQTVDADEAESADTATVDVGERVRQPRAQRFRQNLRNQVSTLPLAFLLLALGAFLLAREQGIEGLPDLNDRVLVIGSVLVGAFTLIFRALLSGRRERGLLFLGLWVWIGAGLWGVLVYGIDNDPDVARWWPLVLWITGVTFIFTYLIERIHDARLLLLAVIAFVAGTTAYLVTSDRIDENVLGDYTDYWPLLISLVGIGVLPAVFRRRTS